MKDMTEPNTMVKMEKKNTYSPEFKSRCTGTVQWTAHAQRTTREASKINCVNGHYYLYEVSSVWNKKKNELKNNQGILGHYYRRGTYPTQHNTEPEIFQRRSLNHKEFGANQYLQDISGEIITSLKGSFQISGGK